MAEQYDFTWKLTRGDTLELPVSVTDSENHGINLAGCAFRFAIKGTDIHEGTPGVTIDDSDGVNGNVTVIVVPSLTRTLSLKKYVFDLEVTYTTGKVETFFVAELEVRGDASV